MKKFMCFIMLICIPCISCNDVEPDYTIENFTIKFTAKHFAYDVGCGYPEVVTDGLRICNVVLQEANSTEKTLHLFNLATTPLIKHIKNEVLRSEYINLLQLVKTTDKVNVAIAVTQGFKEGFELALK